MKSLIYCQNVSNKYLSSSLNLHSKDKIVISELLVRSKLRNFAKLFDI